MTSPEQRTAVREFLGRQRWFAAKGRAFGVERIEPLSWLAEPPADPAVRIELVTVRVGGEGDGARQVYQLPLAYRREPADRLHHALVGSWEDAELAGQIWAYDAPHDKEATPAWLRLLARDHATDDLAFHRVGEPELDPGDTSLVLGGEQSNTSLVFGESALLKVFRQVHHGRNPDIEVHEAFTRAGAGNVARLFGWLEGRWSGGDGTVARGDLGMVSEFFRTASDGWELAITSVRDLYAEADLRADEVGGDFAGESERLGATVAAVHRDLARLLPTATWQRPELRALAAVLRRRLAEAAADVPQVAPYADGLRMAYDELEALAGPVPVQRVHGDLHLGQTMRTVDGWRIIDFEGEPARSLAERSALDSPVRDVAGMLRSFDYAARHLLADHPESGQLAYRAGEWAQRNRDAFCAGYAAVAEADPRAQQVLLRAYETDKAVYEVRYEAHSRPDWLPIPMAALARLAGPRPEPA